MIQAAGGPKAVLRRRGQRYVLSLPGGLRADLGPAPRRERARRGDFAARFATPSGKRRFHSVTGTTLTVGGVQVLGTTDGFAFRVRRGLSTISAPRGTRAWLQRFQGAYEQPYRGGELGARRGRFAFPMLLRHRGRYSLITESGVSRKEVGHAVLRRGTFHLTRWTQWRAIVTGTLADVVETDLPLALGRPSRVQDTSWIEPGRAAWSWLRDRSSPRRLDAQMAFVDLAAAQGWEYVTVDEGWDPAWIGELVAYARDRGVKVILWFHNEDVDAAALDRVAAWGAAGIKADFFLSDLDHNIAAMDDIARGAAERRLVVAFHGCTAPRGLQRTWPNVLTVEAVRGAEYGTTDARDDVNLAFTRNPVGAMDFTPAGAAAPRAIVYESGLQHYSSEGALLEDIPTAWDDTRLLAGEPDSHVVLARRAGPRWYVGGLFAERRPVTVPLPPGRWLARFDDGSEREVSGTLTVDGDFAALLSEPG